MPNSTLFSLDREPLKPASDRSEPVFWLRRLVILSALDASTLIREIEFHRGLNIIQTRKMETDGGPVAGHSVGKTLLMRLIRYTLGEPTFGTEETQKNIAAMFETAFVVAHWQVTDADWIVVRPLRPADVTDSFAARSDNWRQVVDTRRNDHSHREFVQAVNDAVQSGLPKFTLPRGREARWLDVLAWLSRDYQCGYRRANDWRHDDANSGPSLDRDENSLIMQWVMGLMSTDEIDLRLKHRELLNQRTDQKRSAERDQKTLETLRPGLWEKLGLSDDADVVGGQATFHSVKPIKEVSGKIASLEGLKAESRAKSCVPELEKQRDAVQEKVNDAEASIRSCRNLITYFDEQITQYEKDPLRQFAKCQADPCWIREKAKQTASDPATDHHLADLRENLSEQNQKLEVAKREQKLQQKTLDDAIEQVKSERASLAAVLSGIDESIGRVKGFESDAQTYQSLATSVARKTKSLTAADGEIESSLKTQDLVRSRQRDTINLVSDTYEQVLQRIFGTDAKGRIQVDGNGLQPVPDKSLAPEGAAISVMASVLALDITCVAASITGLGHHPRFLMHDSPREGDMEGPLFGKLFKIVHELESLFADGKPSFQYIVTTTTPPPPQFADENGPFVCLTLDARIDNEKLLRTAF